MPPLPPDFFPRAKQLILPYARTEDQRENLLTEAFYLTEPRLFNQIKRSGDPDGFCVHLIRTTVDFGCVYPDTHALALVFTTIRYKCGVDKFAEIDTLSGLINARCGSESAIVPPAPPAAPVTMPPLSIETPYTDRQPTVFISYSHTDLTLAERLIADLQQHGHACWIDKTGIKGGDEWIQSIVDGINNSYAFVSLVSDEANRSTWVRREFLWAEHKKKPIFPLRADDCDPPIYVMERQILDLHSNYAAGFAALLKVLPAPRIVAAEAPEDAAEVVRGVLRGETKLAPTQRELELAYMDRLRFQDFQLERYTALSGDYHKAPAAWARQEFEHTRLVRDHERDTRHFEDAATELRAIRRAVVLGEPGAGKTWTLLAVAKPLYEAALTDERQPIPLFVKLGNWTDTRPLHDFIAAELGELGAHLNALLTSKRAVLLLDGLNEVPAALRTDKYKQVERFIRAHPGLMALVSCREQDYTVDLDFDRVVITPLDPLRIRDFLRRRMKTHDMGETLFWRLAGKAAQDYHADFVKKVDAQHERIFWIAPQLPPDLKWSPYDWDTEKKYSRWNDWLKTRENPSGMMLLARSPYMLEMLARVYERSGVLPDNRGDLFRGFVETLLLREGLAHADKQRITLTTEGDALLDGLARLAYAMQIQRAAAGEDGLSAQTTLPRAEVERLLNDRLLYLAGSASLLTISNDVRFSHQLLQEYFAARYMDTEIKAGRLNAADIWKPDKWWERTNWEEAAILLAGLYSDDCTPVLDWLADANPEVAVLCIARSGAHTPNATKIRLRDQWLPRAFLPSPPPLSGRGVGGEGQDEKADAHPQARAAVGRALGSFTIDDLPADNRKGVSVIILPSPHVGEGSGVRVLLPDIDWVSIPGGTFIYQDDQKITLPAFHISRYLVTYAQFQTFIDAPDGWRNPEWWQGLSASDEHQAPPGDQAFKYNNHPRERVSWYDAVAFCRWLTAQYQALTLNPSPTRGEGLGSAFFPSPLMGEGAGGEVSLPTEQQYERAARWTDGREYPYAGKYDPAKANTSDTGIGQTSAVGIFPNGASVEGVHDLSGNVWEWCLNEYSKPEKTQVSGTNNRVLRGGSWSYSQYSARAVARYNLFPNGRSDLDGFRLVCSSPIMNR
jgi:hypothetical protein